MIKYIIAVAVTLLVLASLLRCVCRHVSLVGGCAYSSIVTDSEIRLLGTCLFQAGNWGYQCCLVAIAISAERLALWLGRKLRGEPVLCIVVLSDVFSNFQFAGSDNLDASSNFFHAATKVPTACASHHIDNIGGS